MHKINELLRVSQLAHQGNFLCGGISTIVWWQICRQAIAMAKSSLISSHPYKASKSAPQLVANGPRTGACLEYLRPTAYARRACGLNEWKIALVRCYKL